MKTIRSIVIVFTLFFVFSATAQEKKRFKIHTVAFYNLENLFDTVDDTTKFDEASPIMEMNADREVVYAKKVKNMARWVHT